MKRKHIPKWKRNLVVINQNNACNHCGTKLVSTMDEIPLYDIDHIEMHAKTRNDKICNLQALCLPCHRKKSVRERKVHRWKPPMNNKKRIKTPDIDKNRFSQFKFNKEDLV